MKNARLRRVVEKSGVENLAQIYTKVKYTPETHQKFSNQVLNYSETGFSELILAQPIAQGFLAALNQTVSNVPLRLAWVSNHLKSIYPSQP